MGDPLDKNTDVGAINSRAQLDKIRELADVGRAEGAERWRRRARCPSAASGSRPRSSPASSQSHRVAREEIFGPVLSVLTFRTPDEAVAKANNTPYGLSAGVWTDKGRRHVAGPALRAGVVWANTFNRFDPASPSAATGESGFGREGGRAAWPPTSTAEDRGDRHITTLATVVVCHSQRSSPAAPSTGCARARGAQRASGTGRCANRER